MMMLRSNADADPVAVLFDAIQSDCFTAIERLGQQVADEWKERISVPVEYARGPRGGRKIIRSEPGEPPRRESGVLWESIAAQTEADGYVVTTVIGSDVEYAPYLQEGTFEMFPRPMMPDPDQLQEQFVNAVADAIEGRA